MKSLPGLEGCLSFINLQLRPPARGFQNVQSVTPRLAVTLSRQSGCGALAIGQLLAQYLQDRSPKNGAPWTVFDRNLVEKVLADHDLPGRLGRFMPEDRILEITDILDELFGLHPPSWYLVRQTADTILHLAELGNVILIGRGANVITATLDHVFHVRLVASFEKRSLRVQEQHHLSAKQAARRIRQEDHGRARYLKKYFHTNIDDPLAYHLVINTDRVSQHQAAAVIGTALLHRQEAL